ncbi:MAG: N4-gp56 family major capsid protein [Christensenellaceae bacterium]|jgi:N4-gp56 family major capsid protein|nr:N4-gp56 family major capsid protein [Christensenellaceae bacterium]
MIRPNSILSVMQTATALAMIQARTNLNTNVSTAATAGNDLSADMKVYYDMQLLRDAEPHLVHRQFGKKATIPQGTGKTIEFRRFADLPRNLTPLTEGVTPNGMSLDVAAITAMVKQYGGYVATSDILVMTAIDNIMSEAVQLLGSNAGIVLDTLCRNVLLTGTNVMYANDSATGSAISARADLLQTANLTVREVSRAVTILRQQNAPTLDGSYVAIAHPNVIHELMANSEDGWMDITKYTRLDDALTGEVGKCMGVRFVESTQAKVFGGASSEDSAVYGTLFIGQGAYGVIDLEGGGLQTIAKARGSAGTSDPLNQRATVGWKAVEATKILVPQYLLRVESCVRDFGDQPEN